MFNEKIKEHLYDNGAAIVGFADLSNVKYCQWKSGVSIALSMTPNIIESISKGPNIDYYNEYNSLNAKLNDLAILTAKFINTEGYHAIAQTTNNINYYGNYRTLIPHKTIATRAGIGWIGKSALLVTNKYGSAIRLTSVLTNMEFDYGTKINESKCGNCQICKESCPGKAISGINWNVDIDRDNFYNAVSCSSVAKSLSHKLINKEVTLCGKCIEVCPYTQKYIRGMLN